MHMQEAICRRTGVLFGPWAARAGAAAGEEPKLHPTKEGKLAEQNTLIRLPFSFIPEGEGMRRHLLLINAIIAFEHYICGELVTCIAS